MKNVLVMKMPLTNTPWDPPPNYGQIWMRTVYNRYYYVQKIFDIIVATNALIYKVYIRIYTASNETHFNRKLCQKSGTENCVVFPFTISIWKFTRMHSDLKYMRNLIAYCTMSSGRHQNAVSCLSVYDTAVFRRAAAHTNV